MRPVEPCGAPANASMIVLRGDAIGAEPLIAYYQPDGVVMTEWLLSDADLCAVLQTRRVRLWMWTGRQPVQPVALEAVAPVPTPSAEDS